MIIFYYAYACRTRVPTLSSSAADEDLELARAIRFLLEAEFVNYAEAVFSWLDEDFVKTVYVFGSNGELYALTRDASTDFKWKKGAYENIPYSQFPN